MEGGGGAGHAERGGGLEREREGVGEGGVGERREVEGGQHAGEEAERVAVAGGVHVRRDAIWGTRRELSSVLGFFHYVHVPVYGDVHDPVGFLLCPSAAAVGGVVGGRQSNASSWC